MIPKLREKISGRQLTIASVGLLVLMSLGAVLIWTARMNAHHSAPTPASPLPLGYFGVPLSHTLTITLPANYTSSGAGSGILAGAWSISAGSLPPGLLLYDTVATDVFATIAGIPSQVGATSAGTAFNFTVSVVDTGGTITSTAYTMEIFGQLVFNDSPVVSDNLADSGEQNAPIYTFTIRALGEDMQLTGLTLQGLGTGLDTQDVERVELYQDVNNNGLVDTGDVAIGTPENFVIDGNFNPVVTITPIGKVIMSTTTETFLVVYDFRNPVDPARTFRLALEQSSNIGWTTLSTNSVHAVGAAFYAAGGNTYTPRFAAVNTTSGQNTPRYSDLTTIRGTAPAVPTLTVTDGGLTVANVNTSAGAIDTTAITLMLFANAGATMSVTQIKIDDVGSGIASAHISSAKLYIDVDRNGRITAADSFIKSGTLVGDQYTFSGLPITVTTPSGLATDNSRISLIIGYTFRTDVPVTVPALTFQAQLQSAVRITAVDQFGATPVVNIGAGFNGSLLTLANSSSATQLGPRPTAASFTDGNRSGTVNAGDTIVVTFDTNLLGTSSATEANFSIPVLGDGLGVGSTATFFSGNRMVITLAGTPALTPAGTFSGATLTAGSASGLNLRDTGSGIRSTYNAIAEPATAALDITDASGTAVTVVAGGVAPVSGSSGSQAATNAATAGSAVCIIRRHVDLPMLSTALRIARENLLESSIGRIIAGVYYSL